MLPVLLVILLLASSLGTPLVAANLAPTLSRDCHQSTSHGGHHIHIPKSRQMPGQGGGGGGGGSGDACAWAPHAVKPGTSGSAPCNCTGGFIWTTPADGATLLGMVNLTGETGKHDGDLAIYADDNTTPFATLPLQAHVRWWVHWDSGSVPDGNHTLRVTFRRYGETRTARIDNHPTVRVLAPHRGDGVAGVVNLTGRARDLGPGVRNVSVQVDDGRPLAAHLSGAGAGPLTWWLPWESWTVPDGRHRLRVVASDGRFRSEAPRTFYTDNDPPAAYRNPPDQHDSNGNGMGDAFQAAYQVANASADLDHDGLPNLQEFLWDTIPTPSVPFGNGGVRLFPNAADYDRDQWPDGPEARYWSRYLDPATNASGAGSSVPTTSIQSPGYLLDTDGDGVPNIHDADSDNDHLLDGAEIAVGTYPEFNDSDCAVSATTCPSPLAAAGQWVPTSNPTYPPRLVPGTALLLPMDVREAGDGLTRDAGGGHHDGELQDATPVGGRYGRGYHLDGASSIRVPWPEANASLGGDAAFLLWFRPATTATAPLIRWQGPGAEGYQLLYEGDALSFRMATSTGWSQAAAPANVSPGTWHHAAGVRRGDELELYLDGHLLASAPVRGSPVFSGSPVLVGDGFRGDVDQLRVLDRAPTNPRNPALAPLPAGTTVAGPTEQETLAAWRLDINDSLHTRSHLLWDATGHADDLDAFGVTPVAGPDAAHHDALRFEGGSRLSLPKPLPIPPASFTLGAWVRPLRRPWSDATILSNNPLNASCGPGVTLLLDATNRPALAWRTGTNWTRLHGQERVPYGTWTHVAASFDGTNATFFVDGEPAGSAKLAPPAVPGTAPHAAPSVPSPACRGSFTAGRTEEPAKPGDPLNVDGRYFAGSLDGLQVRVLPRTSSASTLMPPFDANPVAEAPVVVKAATRTELQDLLAHPYAEPPAPAGANGTAGSGDGLPDAQELAYWSNRTDLDPTGHAYRMDLDHDGIPNIRDPDSDGDGCLDGQEIARGTDPAVPDCPAAGNDAWTAYQRTNVTNANLAHLDPTDRAYLENRTRDATAQVNGTAQVDDQAIVDSIDQEVTNGLDVAQEASPIAGPEVRAVENLWTQANPLGVVHCAHEAAGDTVATAGEAASQGAANLASVPHEVLGDAVDPNGPPDTAPAGSGRTVARVSAIADPAAACLAHALHPPGPRTLAAQAVNAAPALTGTALLPPKRLATAPVRGNATGSRISPTVLDADGATAGPAVNASEPVADPIEAAVANLTDTSVPTLTPRFLYDTAGTLTALDLLPKVATAVENTTGIPLVEGIDGTRYNLALRWNGTWHAAYDLPMGSWSRVNVTGDAEPEARTRIVAAGTNATGLVRSPQPYAPRLSVVLPPSSVDVTGVLAYLQHPRQPRVIVLGETAHADGSLPRELNLTLAQLAWNGTAPRARLEANTTTPGGSLHLVAAAYPVDEGKTAKPPRPGRRPSLDLLINHLPVASTLDVGKNATTDAASLTWTATTPTGIQVAFLDRNTSRTPTTRFGFGARLPHAPDRVAFQRVGDVDAGTRVQLRLRGSAPVGAADLTVEDALERAKGTPSIVHLAGRGLPRAWQARLPAGMGPTTVRASAAPASVGAVWSREGTGCRRAPSTVELVSARAGGHPCWSLDLSGVRTLVVDPSGGGSLRARVRGSPSVASAEVLLGAGEPHGTTDVAFSDIAGNASLAVPRTVGGTAPLTWSSPVAGARADASFQAPGQAEARFHATGLPKRFTGRLEPSNGTYVIVGSETIGDVLLQVDHGTTVARRSGDALDVWHGRRGTNLALRLHATRSLSLQSKAPENLAVRIDQATRQPLHVHVEPSARLDLAVPTAPRRFRVSARPDASGTSVNLSLDASTAPGNVSLAAATASDLLHLDVVGTPRHLGVKNAPRNGTLRVEASSSVASLDLLQAAGFGPKNPLLGLPTADYVIRRSTPVNTTADVPAAGGTNATAMVHVHLQGTSALDLRRVGPRANLTWTRQRPSGLVLSDARGTDAWNANLTDPPQRVVLDLTPQVLRYRGPSESALPFFAATHRNGSAVPVQWTGANVAGRVGITWNATATGLDLHVLHRGRGSVGRVLVTGPAPTPAGTVTTANLHLRLRDVPSNLTATLDTVGNRLDVTTPGGSDVGRLDLDYATAGASLRDVPHPLNGTTAWVREAPKGTNLALHARHLHRLTLTAGSPSNRTATLRMEGEGSTAPTAVAYRDPSPAGTHLAVALPATPARATLHVTAPEASASSSGPILASTSTADLPLATLSLDVGNRSLRLADARLPPALELRWSAGAPLTLNASAPADLTIRTAGAGETAPWIPGAGDILALRDNASDPRLGLHLTGTTTLELRPQGNLTRTGLGTPELRVATTNATSTTDLDLAGVPGSLDLGWRGAGPRLDLRGSATLASASVHVQGPNDAALVRLARAPGRVHVAASVPNRVVVSTKGTGTLGRLRLVQNGGGTQITDRLGAREGAVLVATPANGDRANATRSELSLNMSNVISFYLDAGVVGLEANATRSAGSTAPSARITVLGANASFDAVASELPSTWNLRLRQSGDHLVVGQTTAHRIPEERLMVNNTKGYGLLSLTNARDVTVDVHRASQDGTLAAAPAVGSARLTTAASYGAADLAIEDATQLAWNVATDGRTGTVTAPTASPPGSVQGFIAPSNGTEPSTVSHPACPRKRSCLLQVNLQDQAPVEWIGPVTNLGTLAWDLRDPSAPNVALQRAPGSAVERATLRLLDVNRTTTVESPALPANINLHLRASPAAASERVPVQMALAQSQAAPLYVNYSTPDGDLRYGAQRAPASTTWTETGTSNITAQLRASGTTEGLNLVDGLAPRQRVLTLRAATLARRLDLGLRPGDCGASDLGHGLAFRAEPGADGSSGLHLNLSNDGATPNGTGGGLDARCKGGNASVRLDVPVLPAPGARLTMARCTTEAVVPVDGDHETPYYMEGAGGIMEGSAELSSGGGSDVLRIYAEPWMAKPRQQTGNPSAIRAGYRLARDATQRIAQWHLVYLPIAPDAGTPGAGTVRPCLAYHGRPVQWMNITTADMPGSFALTQGDVVTKVAPGGHIGTLDVRFALQAGASGGSGSMATSGGAPGSNQVDGAGSSFQVIIPHLTVQRFHLLAQETSGAGTQTTYPVWHRGDSYVRVDKQGSPFHEELRMRGVDDLQLKFHREPSFTGIHLNLTGQQVAFNYWAENDTQRERLLIRDLPRSFRVDGAMSPKAFFKGQVANSEAISDLQAWLNIQGFSNLEFHLQGIPPSSLDRRGRPIAWPLWANLDTHHLQVGQVRVNPNGGPVDWVGIGLTTDDRQSQPNRYVEAGFHNVTLRQAEWDLDGDTRFPGIPYFVYVDTGRTYLNDPGFRGRFDNVGFGFGAPGSIQFQRLQLKISMESPLGAWGPQVPDPHPRGTFHPHPGVIPWFDVLYQGTWYQVPGCFFKPNRCTRK